MNRPVSAKQAARSAKADAKRKAIEEKRAKRALAKAEKAEAKRVRNERTAAEREAKRKADYAVIQERNAKIMAETNAKVEASFKEMVGEVKPETNGFTREQLKASAQEIAAHREEARKLSEPAMKAWGQKLLDIQAALKAQGGSFDLYLRTFKEEVGSRSECYLAMAVAGGKATVAEVRAQAAARNKKHRDARKAAAQAAKEPLRYTDSDMPGAAASAERDVEQVKAHEIKTVLPDDDKPTEPPKYVETEEERADRVLADWKKYTTTAFNSLPEDGPKGTATRKVGRTWFNSQRWDVVPLLRDGRKAA